MKYTRHVAQVGDVVLSTHAGVNVAKGVYGIVTVVTREFVRCFWPINRCLAKTNEPINGYGLAYTYLELVPSAPADNVRAGDTVLHIPYCSTEESDSWVGQPGVVISVGPHPDDGQPAAEVGFSIPNATDFVKWVCLHRLKHLTAIANCGPEPVSPFQVGTFARVVKKSCGVMPGFVGEILPYNGPNNGKNNYLTLRGDCRGNFGHTGVQTYNVYANECEPYPPGKDVVRTHSMKVGDRVIRTYTGHGGMNRGDIGTVTEIGPSYVRIKPDKETTRDWSRETYAPSAFELLRASHFQVGDIIRTVNQSNGVYAGFEGRVTQLGDDCLQAHGESTRCNHTVNYSLQIKDCTVITRKDDTMPENVFEVGDIVRRTSCEFGKLKVGDVGVVTAIAKYTVKVKPVIDPPDGWDVPGYDPKNFEKVAREAFNPGDYVKRINCDNGGYMRVGQYGIVKDYNKADKCVKVYLLNDLDAFSNDAHNLVVVTKEEAEGSHPATPTVGTATELLTRFKFNDTVTNIVSSFGKDPGQVGKVIEIDDGDKSVKIRRDIGDCWLYIKDCVLASDQEPTLMLAPGTRVRITGNSFGSEKGDVAEILYYDFSDDTYRIRKDSNGREAYARAKYCQVINDTHALPAVDPSVTIPTTDQSETTQPEGNTMSLNFETIHYINGNRVNDYTPAALVDLIAREEAEIAKLKTVKALPARVKAEIDKREQALNSLVSFLDTQDAEAATKAAQ